MNVKHPYFFLKYLSKGNHLLVLVRSVLCLSGYCFLLAQLESDGGLFHSTIPSQHVSSLPGVPPPPPSLPLTSRQKQNLKTHFCQFLWKLHNTQVEATRHVVTDVVSLPLTRLTFVRGIFGLTECAVHLRPDNLNY